MIPTKLDVVKQRFGVEDPIKAHQVWEDRISKANYPRERLTSLELPYRSKFPTPKDTPIPTIDDIHAAKSKVIHEGRHRIYQVSDVFIVKTGYGMRVVQEAENLIYLQENSSVRVPKVYAVFRTNGCSYLVMEIIEGHPLSEDYYKQLDEGLRTKIHGKLRQQIDYLHSVSIGNEEYYGRVNRRAWGVGFALFALRGSEPHGPFNSYESLIEAMYEAAMAQAAASSICVEFKPTTKLLLSNFKHCLLSAGTQDRTPKLIHMDLTFGNIMVKPIEDADGKVVDYDVVIIDWESLCWGPSWFQIAWLLTPFSIDSQLQRELMVWDVAKNLFPVNMGLAYFLVECKDLPYVGLP